MRTKKTVQKGERPRRLASREAQTQEMMSRISNTSMNTGDPLMVCDDVWKDISPVKNHLQKAFMMTRVSRLTTPSSATHRSGAAPAWRVERR